MIITFSHPKGGVGKTLLAFNYAIYSINKNKEKVTVIDLDGQHSISNFNKLRALKTDLKPLEILTFDDVKELVSFLQTHNDHKIIIDTGGFDSAYNRVALALADKIITPVSDSPVELMRLFDFDRILKEISETTKAGKIITHIVLNRLHSSLKNIDYIKEPLIGKDSFVFLDSGVRDRARIKFSVSDGTSVFEEKDTIKDEKAIYELEALFREIDNLKTERI